MVHIRMQLTQRYLLPGSHHNAITTSPSCRNSLSVAHARKQIKSRIVNGLSMAIRTLTVDSDNHSNQWPCQCLRLVHKPSGQPNRLENTASSTGIACMSLANSTDVMTSLLFWFNILAADQSHGCVSFLWPWSNHPSIFSTSFFIFDFTFHVWSHF